jgi:hypothetical protein
MIHVICTVRAYDKTADTASVELAGLGVVDTWVDGIKVGPGLARAGLVYGAQGVLAMPDAHRICDATLISLVPPQPIKTVQSSGKTQTTLTGRDTIQTDGSGNGSVSVTFSTPFTAAPSISVLADNMAPMNVSAITTTGFTATLAGPGSANSYVQFSWSATGT